MDPRVEKILKLPAWQRGSLVLIVLMILVGLFAYMVYMPMADELDQKRQENAALSAKLQQDQRIANNLPAFKEEYEKMQARLDQALTELPNEKEIPTLLTNIGGLVKESGLEITLFKPQKEVPKGFYAEVPVALQLTGTYHQMAMFSYKLGQLSRIVNLNKLKLSKPKIEGNKALLSIDCTATTFRFLPQDKKK